MILAILLLAMGGCKINNQSDNGDSSFITVDIEADYPQKKLDLQDLMEVEYIALQTSDDFLCQGHLFDTGKKFMLIGNDLQDGNIFLLIEKVTE